MGDRSGGDGGAPLEPRRPFGASGPVAEPIPAPRVDLERGAIGDKVLLLDRAQAQAHLLNASAAWVWDLVDGVRTTVDLATIVGAELHADPSAVIDDIGRTIASFDRAGLLGASPPVGPTGSSREPLTALPGDLGGPFEAIGYAFGVTADPVELGTEIEPLLEPLLGALRIDEPASARGTTFSIHQNADCPVGGLGFEVRVGEEVLVRAGDVVAAIDHLLVEINRRAIDAASDRLVFHAGVVEVGGRGVILPAASGSGKSTLTAGLVAAGARYGTDEAAVIEPMTLQVEPYRKPLSLSEASLEALVDWDGGRIGELRDRPRAVGDKCHVAPARLGTSMTEPTQLGVMVFPRYVDDGPTSIERLDVEDALVALVPCTFAATWAVEDGLARVVAMVESTPAYRLDVGDLGEAIRLVGEVAGGGAP